MPSIAIKMLWNLATGLSLKFTNRNKMLKQQAAALEVAQKKVAKHEEIAELREAATKLRMLVIKPGASLPAVSAAAPSALGALRSCTSWEWEAVFRSGLESVRRLELEVKAPRPRGIRGSQTTATLPSTPKDGTRHMAIPTSKTTDFADAGLHRATKHVRAQ